MAKTRRRYNVLGGSFFSKDKIPLIESKIRADVRYSRANRAYQVYAHKPGLLLQDEIKEERWFKNRKSAENFAKIFVSKRYRR